MKDGPGDKFGREKKYMMTERKSVVGGEVQMRGAKNGKETHIAEKKRNEMRKTRV